ncbi:UvrD-helicase domain-containing protein [Lactococcus lactis]|uniref:UvrD-helicase domain-containing protein n=1 Tax=Lactococcus lactis TaxID=1358 RepID=UPI0022B90CE1|nr:ATP-dependent helicase [Lactococcus lactis]MCZ8491047.1 ATP-dependent helicase [Lactococcus lactis]
MKDKKLAEKIISSLNPEQQSIVLDFENNLYVTACPGSGKTRTLTWKIAYLCSLYPDSLKKIIAITYTSRAAHEIQERLEAMGINNPNVWVGTIHQFCLTFIIRPFGFNCPRISKGFKIIDDYLSRRYLKACAEDLKIKFNYYDKINLRLTEEGQIIEFDPEKRKIVEEYHFRLKKNNEIDFDLILTLALQILKEKPNVTKIISRTIRAIYVDEFQDTSEFQYQILGYLSRANCSIKFGFLGDTDQAIYTGLGGVAKSKIELEVLMKQSFESKTLGGCYRSTQEIIEYYSKYQQKSFLITSKLESTAGESIIQYSNSTSKELLAQTIANILKSELSHGIQEEEICIASPNYFILAPLVKELKKLLPHVHFRSQDIYPIKPDDLNLFYKISFLIFTDIGKKVWLRKKVASEILEILRKDYGVVKDNDFLEIDLLDVLNSSSSSKKTGLEYMQEIIYQFIENFGIQDSTKEILYTDLDDFISKAQERINSQNLETNIESFRSIYETKKGVNASTIHKIKGEEYHTVIGIGLLTGFIPNWDNIHKDLDKGEKEAKKLLYVLMSRAKNNLFLFSENGRKTKSGYDLLPTIFL